jgi:hypothetical protein
MTISLASHLVSYAATNGVPGSFTPRPTVWAVGVTKDPEENGTRRRPKNWYAWLPSRGKYHFRFGDFFYGRVLLSALDNPIFQTNFRNAEKTMSGVMARAPYTQLRSNFAAATIEEVCRFLCLTENSHVYYVCFLVAVVGLVLWKCCYLIWFYQNIKVTITFV